MNVKEAFDRGEYLDIVDNSSNIDDIQERLVLGISLYRLGRKNEAKAVLEKISAEVSELVKADYYLAKIHADNSDTESARACVERYLAFYPDDDEALDVLDSFSGGQEMINEPSADLAEIYSNQGYYEEALEIYSDLVEGTGDPEIRKKALHTQGMHVIKTLESWLERSKK